jgi:hypothetical protein
MNHEGGLEQPVRHRKSEEVINRLAVSRIGRMNGVGFPSLTLNPASPTQSGALLD